MTGSSDNYLRVWALDFSEYILEAHHENGGILGVDITPDGLYVACGTGNCAIGILDMAQNSYSTLVRSHSAPIVDIDVHNNGQWAITASRDNTIRLWSTSTFEETHEFTSTDDSPLSLNFHPYDNTFACGFESGTVLVFEVLGTQALHSKTQHDCPIAKVQHSPDGWYLASVSVDGIVCVYDSEYNPLRTLQV